MKRQRVLAAAILIAGGALLVARVGRPLLRRPPPVRTQRDTQPERAKVSRALDGDSVVLSGGVQLRYIGVDAPERGEPFAEEARAWNRRMVEGRAVRLEYDEERRDRYDRILAYVWVEDGEGEVLVNAELLRAGLGMAYPHFPNDRYRDRLTASQTEARRAKRGIWSVERPPTAGPLIGSRSRFHRPDCEHVSEIRRPRRLDSREAALDAGLSPCKKCNP